MTTDTKPVSILRKQDGTFAPGTSGNPAGRPRGARYRLAKALDELAATEAVDVLTKAIEMAKDGDVEAVRLVLRRSWPVPKGRPIGDLDIPPLQTAADALAAMTAIVAGVQDGMISTDEARDLSDMVDNFRKTVELVEIDRRITALEKRAEQAQAPGWD